MAGTAFGQTITGRLNRDPYYFAAVNCPVATTIVDGSQLICKAGGVAWFVSPVSARPSSAWANGCCSNTASIARCCISEWGVLEACLQDKTCCYRNNSVYSSWFVPSLTQFQNPGVVCKTRWTCCGTWWSSNANSGNRASSVFFDNYTASSNNNQYKTDVVGVVAFKCVTY